MKKKLVQSICYVAVAVVACILSVKGIVPTSGSKEAVSVQTEQPDNVTAMEAGDGQRPEAKASGETEESEDQDSISTEAEIKDTDSDTLDNTSEAQNGTETSSEPKYASGEGDTENTEKEKPKKEKTKKEKSQKEDSQANTDGNEQTSTDDSAQASTDDNKSDTAVEKNGTYYTYRVTMSPDSLLFYPSEEGGEAIGSVPSGSCGYVIRKTGSSRSLILYRGKVGYCSNMYLEMTQIPAEEYPDALVGLGEDDIGTLLFGGSAAGEAEK